MTPAHDEARRLMRLAVRDRETFDLLMPLPKASIAALGFHAQQSVEKAIKAVCVLRGIEVRRTHDLAALGQAILDAGGTLPVSIDELRTLNPFAVEFRYDDEVHSTLSREQLRVRLYRISDWAGRLLGAG